MAHVSKKESSDLEDVVVSGMFTAVQDFINDAFTTDTSDEEWELDEMKFGDHKILIERSQELYLAVIFEGNGDRLRLRVKKLLAEINHEYGEELKDWDGDMRILKGIRAMTFILLDKKEAKRLKQKHGHLKVKKKRSELDLKGTDALKGTGLEELDDFIEGIEGTIPIGFEEEEFEVFECPVCGKDNKTKDPKCVRCGADYQKLRKQKEKPKLEIMECPACGKEVGEDAAFCPNCRVEFIGEEELEVLECPMCGATIDPSATSCYNCGVEFVIERKIDGGFEI
jgi:DNA-directed RNA polymerase subunit RPC12/RpoP